MRKVAYYCLSIITAVLLWLYHQDFAPLVGLAVKAQVVGMRYQDTADEGVFKLLFCGTGSPTRTVDRGQPCLALVANQKLFLFDAGEGTLGKLHQYKAPVGKLTHIFLTHLHSDHFSGVAEVLHNSWLYGRIHNVRLIGPPGTQQLIDGIAASNAADIAERMHVLAPDGVSADNALAEVQEETIADDGLYTVFEEQGLLIQAFRVTHPDWPFAYGCKITHQKKVIVISGDTTISAGVEHHAKDADVLIHEATNTALMHLIADELDANSSVISSARIKRIVNVHSDTLALAELAQKINVKHLLLNHLISALPTSFVTDRYFTSGMDENFDGEISVAFDGWWFYPNK